MVAVDTQTGEELSATTEGVREIANVTMAADEATLISNNFGFLTQVFWDRGLMGFNPACGPVPPFGSGCPPPITFKLLEPKPFDMAAPGGVVAWTPFRPEEPISGKHLKVMDEVSAADNFLSFETEDASIEMPGPGSALDPRRHSAEVTLFNPTTGEKQVIGLPAENWSLKNNRYDYKDSDRASGPCDKVKLADGVLEVRCGGEQLTFSLDEPSQGSLGVGFNISPSIVMCALFGGDIKEDSGSAEGGSFKSDYAEPSDECVIPD
jgi:hypothetical protein